MKIIQIKRYGDFDDIRKAAMITQGKLTHDRMTRSLLDKYLVARHSVIREVGYKFIALVPKSVALLLMS